MSCPERQRLFDLYFFQVTNYQAVVERVHRSKKDSGAFGKMNEAKKAAEHARIELEQHEREHGCLPESKSRQHLITRVIE